MIIHDMEQRTPEWFEIRFGKASASNFHNLLTAKTLKRSTSLPGYAYTLAADLFTKGSSNSWGGNNDIQRGRYLEDNAIAQYEFVNDVEIKECGFISDDSGDYGCSPDGLINDDGMIEVKCVNPKDHVENIVNWMKDKTINPKHRAQVQGQLMIGEREWCDLVFYHYSLPSLTCRILPDKEYHAILKPLIDECIDIRNATLEMLNGL